MKIDTSSLDILYAIINSPEKTETQDKSFISLLNSTAYRELLKEELPEYTIETIQNTINHYKEFKYNNQFNEEYCFINKRLQIFEENYQNHELNIEKIFYNSKKEALEFLPINSFCKDPSIVLTILFLSNQLGMSLYNCIIINYTNFFEYNGFNQKLLAHELHHFYAQQICKLSDDIYFKENTGEVLLFMVRMANEGIAELITIPFVIEFPEKTDCGGKKIYNEYKLIIEHFKQFKNIIENTNDLEKLKFDLENFRKNPYVFHALSYFIANIIYSAFGKDIIFEIIYNPLKFLKFYNQAAKFLEKDNLFLLNNDFISLLENNI